MKDAVRTIVRTSRLLESACEPLSLPQYRLLALVDEGGERASRLAESLAVAKPTVTAMVDGLVERGLLSRSEVVGDRRAIRISMTPAGQEALGQADAAMAERLELLLDRVDDREGALAALRALRTAFDALVAEHRGARR